MNTASGLFLGFGLLIAILYNLNPAVRWRQAILLVANLGFLASFSTRPAAWMPYLIFLVLGYLSYRLVLRRIAGAFLPLLLAVILCFFWLKKYTFLPNAAFLAFPYVTLGLSYVLFRLLHLLIDTREGVLTEPIDPLTFLNYTLNFTAIVSGPIQLFPDYAHSQLQPAREPLNLTVAAIALKRIIWGYFKISITGVLFETLQTHTLAALAKTAAEPPLSRIAAAAILGVSYPLYLYCNFSGYTDIVIGVARGIRLTLPENFDRPFSSTNFLELWSRWHISLSSWLKTYVYSPLLKSLMARVPNLDLAPYLGVFAYFVTFFLIGVWHGRTSVFVVFGILQGLGVSMNKLYQLRMTKFLGKKRYRALTDRLWYRSLARGLTFTYFAFSLVWFWSNWAQMAQIVHALGIVEIALAWLLLLLASSLILALYEHLRAAALSLSFHGEPFFTSRYAVTVVGTAMVVILVTALNILSTPAPEIVYKAF